MRFVTASRPKTRTTMAIRASTSVKPAWSRVVDVACIDLLLRLRLDAAALQDGDRPLEPGAHLVEAEGVARVGRRGRDVVDEALAEADVRTGRAAGARIAPHPQPVEAHAGVEGAAGGGRGGASRQGVGERDARGQRIDRTGFP